MNDQLFQVLISLVGGIISLLLLVVGYQLKVMNAKTDSVVGGLATVNTSLTVLINDKKYMEEKIKKNEKAIDKAENECVRINSKIDDTINKMNNMQYRLRTKCEKLRGQDLIGDVEVGL